MARLLACFDTLHATAPPAKAPIARIHGESKMTIVLVMTDSAAMQHGQYHRERQSLIAIVDAAAAIT